MEDEDILESIKNENIDAKSNTELIIPSKKSRFNLSFLYLVILNLQFKKSFLDF